LSDLLKSKIPLDDDLCAYSCIYDTKKYHWGKLKENPDYFDNACGSIVEPYKKLFPLWITNAFITQCRRFRHKILTDRTIGGWCNTKNPFFFWSKIREMTDNFSVLNHFWLICMTRDRSNAVTEQVISKVHRILNDSHRARLSDHGLEDNLRCWQNGPEFKAFDPQPFVPIYRDMFNYQLVQSIREKRQSLQANSKKNSRQKEAYLKKQAAIKEQNAESYRKKRAKIDAGQGSTPGVQLQSKTLRILPSETELFFDQPLKTKRQIFPPPEDWGTEEFVLSSQSSLQDDFQENDSSSSEDEFLSGKKTKESKGKNKRKKPD
jgi:hypothetical protein